jgi:hypothetical protein
MKVGVNLINFGPGANPDSLKRWAQVTESLNQSQNSLLENSGKGDQQATVKNAM